MIDFQEAVAAEFHWRELDLVDFGISHRLFVEVLFDVIAGFARDKFVASVFRWRMLVVTEPGTGHQCSAKVPSDMPDDFAKRKVAEVWHLLYSLLGHENE